jgi:hypothetical protein
MGRFDWVIRSSGGSRRILVLGVSAALGGCAGSTTGGTSNADGGGCTTGSEGCACYPNDTCNAPFTCASHLCVNLGTGGTGQGGMPASGGSPAVSGGTLGIGGFVVGMGGFVVGVGGFPSGQGGSSNTGGVGGYPMIAGFQIQAEGYVVAGTWHGYAWTAAVTSSVPVGGATSTIAPLEFSAVAAGATELCAQGSVGPATDYGGIAMLGMNVNQPQIIDGGDPPLGTLAISGTGITVKYTNPGASVIRVQIQTPAGETDPTGRWCATLSGAGGIETLTWDMFWGGVADTTEGCWNSGGINPPLGTQIQNVALTVPGGNAVAVPFNFCLQGIIQAR